jgi:cysteine desulfurase/selenocysteine lyase
MHNPETVALDVNSLRKQFPVLHQQVNGYPLIYFDNAATSQKPDTVLQALQRYYSGYNANIHRGIHTLAERATEAFEATREAIADFIHAPSSSQVIFVRGVTEAINLVASTWGRTHITSGDEILISELEHHSNIVPWQLLCLEKNATLKVIPVTDAGELDLNKLPELLTSRTKLVSINHASNSLGTINPVKQIITKAHEVGAVVVIDGAQAGAHLPINVQELDCDFYALSSHKMYGPTGVGVLYGRKTLLEEMPPYQGGGEMIKDVSFEATTFNDIPYKFEAGTPNIADVVAFKEAMTFIKTVGRENIAAHEHELLAYAHERLRAIPGVRIIGTAPQKVSVVSFVIDGLHPFDLGQLLDARGIAVRTGHHCTQPLMKRFQIEGTVRASFSVYNTQKEIDALIDGIHHAMTLLR